MKSMKSFPKGAEAPCVRFVLTGGEFLVLPYMALNRIEMGASGDLIVATFGTTMIQIEGRSLGGVLDELQKFGVHTLAAAKDENDTPVITRIVAVQIREESDSVSGE